MDVFLEQSNETKSEAEVNSSNTKSQSMKNIFRFWWQRAIFVHDELYQIHNLLYYPFDHQQSGFAFQQSKYIQHLLNVTPSPYFSLVTVPNFFVWSKVSGAVFGASHIWLLFTAFWMPWHLLIHTATLSRCNFFVADFCNSHIEQPETHYFLLVTLKKLSDNQQNFSNYLAGYFES